MEYIQHYAQQRPCAKDGSPSRRGPVDSEDANGRVVQSVEDVCTSGKVVQFFRELKVACVENGTEDPAGDSNVGEQHVKRTQTVRRWDMSADLDKAMPVRIEVSQGEEHGKGLLHAEKSVEGPFAVELDNGLVSGDSLGGDNVLACVVTFGGAVPEEKATVGGFPFHVSRRKSWNFVIRARLQDVRMGVWSFPGPQFSALQTYRRLAMYGGGH